MESWHTTFSQDQGLASYTTHVVCVNFLDMCGGTYNLKWTPTNVWEIFHGNFIHSQGFCKKSAEENFLNRDFKSNKPKHYLLDQGDFQSWHANLKKEKLFALYKPKLLILYLDSFTKHNRLSQYSVFNTRKKSLQRPNHAKTSSYVAISHIQLTVKQERVQLTQPVFERVLNLKKKKKHNKPVDSGQRPQSNLKIKSSSILCVGLAEKQINKQDTQAKHVFQPCRHLAP